MSDRVRIVDSATGELLHEGPRSLPRSPRDHVLCALPPGALKAEYNRILGWTFDEWLNEIAFWERLTGAPVPGDLADIVCAVHDVDQRWRDLRTVLPFLQGAADQRIRHYDLRTVVLRDLDDRAGYRDAKALAARYRLFMAARHGRSEKDFPA